MQERYFVEMSDGQRYGPADLAMLKEWVAQGRVNRSTTLVSERTNERLAAENLPGLFDSATDGLPPVVPPAPSAGGTPPPPSAPFPPAPRKSNNGLIVGLVIVGVLALCGLPVIAAILFPVFAQARLAAKRTQGLSNVKQLATGILIYSADFDDRFPRRMESATAMQPAVGRYVKDPLVFKSLNPKGGELLGDKRLNGRDMMELATPNETIMLYDSLPWETGRAPVAYTDGSARLIRHDSIASLMAPNPFGGATPEKQ